MRLISFSLTADQVRARTKTETRRLGWRHLRVGEVLRGVKKAMGRKPGEELVTLAIVRVEQLRRERLDAITADAVQREGFPDLTPAGFVSMFCTHMKCDPSVTVTVIQFSYVQGAANG